MKRIVATLLLPGVLAISSLGLGVVTTSVPASATEYVHTTMDHSWKGTISKINAKMGTTSSFNMKDGRDTYVVHWNSMTHFVRGSKKLIKVGSHLTVTGTVKGMIITATKLNV
jgi:hypothetical protein